MATNITAQAAQEVNTTTAGDQSGPSLAMLANGGHVVAWNSGGNVIAQFFDAAGGKTGGEITLFTGHALGGIGTLADGSVVACASRTTTGPDGYPLSSLWFQRLDAAGNVIAPPTLVDDTGNYDVRVSGGAVYAMPGGGFGITDVHTTRPVPWSSVDETVRVFDANNTATGVAILAESGYLQETAQMRSGGFLVEGSTSFGPTPVDSAMWRTVDAQGNTIASVALTGTYGVDGYGEGGAVAFADGRALAVWSHIVYGYKGVGTVTWQAQWIDASGHASGAPFTLGLDTQWNPQFTALADGSFVATWAQQSSYGTPYDVYAQHFDASAQADTGAVFLTSMDANNSGYKVSATLDGGFLIATQRAGDGLDVWQQKFDVSSGPSTSVGGTLSVNGGITPVGDGDFVIAGSAGLDQIALSSPHTAWTVTQDAGTATLSGPGGTDVLRGVERVRFDDGYAIALDVNGDAGQAYRLYQAAFDRAPDLPGLGFQMNDLDMGYSLVHVAQNFIDSPEFQSTYGPGISNTEFITLLYRNVLNREPEAEGLQYHLDEFAHGDTRAAMLTHFSESPENQANVIGAIQDGMLYVPYA